MSFQRENILCDILRNSFEKVGWKCDQMFKYYAKVGTLKLKVGEMNFEWIVIFISIHK